MSSAGQEALVLPLSFWCRQLEIKWPIVAEGVLTKGQFSMASFPLTRANVMEVVS